MQEELLVLIPLGFTWGFVAVVRAVVENGTRRKAIEKGIPEDVARTLFQTAPASGDQSLKWGLIAGALGLSLMFISTVGIEFRDDRPLAFGIPLFFVGIALMAYHWIAVRKTQA
jgi:hypothetical protein